MAKVPVEVVDRLRELDREAADELLGDLLSAPQRRAIVARAQHLLTVLARSGMLPPVTENVAERRVSPAS